MQLEHRCGQTFSWFAANELVPSCFTSHSTLRYCLDLDIPVVAVIKLYAETVRIGHSRSNKQCLNTV